MSTTEWLLENTQRVYPFINPLSNDREFESVLADLQVTFTDDYPDEAVAVAYFELIPSEDEDPLAGPVVSTDNIPPTSSPYVGEIVSEDAVPTIDDAIEASVYRIKLNFEDYGEFFDSDTATQQSSIVGDYLVLQWYTPDVVVKAVLCRSHLNDLGAGAYTFTDAYVVPSCIFRLPTPVTGITAAGVSVPGGEATFYGSIASPVTFAEGYNCKLEEVTDSAFSSPTRKVVRISFIPGAGMGRISDCPDTDDGYLRYINGAGPDDLGNFALNGDQCIQVQPDYDTYGSEANGLFIATACTPCCDCDDYENVYVAIRRLMREALTEVGDPLIEAKGELANAVDTFNYEVSLRDKIFFELRMVSYSPFMVCTQVIIANSLKSGDVVPKNTTFKITWNVADGVVGARYSSLANTGAWQTPGKSGKTDAIMTGDVDPVITFTLDKDIPSGSWWYYNFQFHWYTMTDADDGDAIQATLSSTDAPLNAGTIGVKVVNDVFHKSI